MRFPKRFKRTVLLIALLGAAGCAGWHCPAFAQAQAKLDVRKLGAAGDGRTKDTIAFQKALDRCAAAGGGEVLVPAGDYLIGAVMMGRATTLRLEKGATIHGSPDIADYPLTAIRWEGRWRQGHGSLLTARDADGIAIVGPGKIAGALALGRLRDPRGPALIEPIHCNGVRLEGFSTQYANMWSIHPTRCRNVTARGLTIRSKGGNGDGIDVDSCSKVLIEGCDIDTGDDSIALKSGRGMEGYKAAEPTEDVTIRDCRLGDSIFACIGIGSETSGGIRNVLIERVTFTHAKTNAIYIKSQIGRGAGIENITARDLEARDIRGAFLRINLMGSGRKDEEQVPGLQGIPYARNFSFTGIKLENCGALAEATLIPEEKPVQGLTLAGVAGSCKKGLALANIKGIDLRGIAVTGCAEPKIQIRNVTGKGLEGAVALTNAGATARR